MATADEFRVTLKRVLQEATDEGHENIIISAGELHRIVGGYPGTNHRMPTCCSVMKSILQNKDRILYEPPSGKGASLLIEYALPR